MGSAPARMTFVFSPLVIAAILLIQGSDGSLRAALSTPKARVMSLLSGSFSNAAQAAQDAREGRETANKGGHELITVVIERHSSDELQDSVLVARYFYGFDPAQTFRFRLYSFKDDEPGTIPSPDVTMRVHRPLPAVQQRLASAGYDTSKRYLLPLLEDCEYLDTCDLLWQPLPTMPLLSSPSLYSGHGHVLVQTHKPPVHWYSQDAYRGRLLCGVSEVASQRDPNVRLLVQDDLVVNRQNLEINDQIFDKATGALVIGNSLGIPYKLIRCDGENKM